MAEASEVLKQYFGYSAFREGQEQLIRGILAGRDCLGVMPTGAGKSLCFQLPAIMSEGVTLVISPLISLMKDQVNALTQAGIKAAYINSSLSERQIQAALSNARDGLYKIIYVAPERLETQGFMHFALSAPIFMVTVDEAHCISQWGQDFRPGYLKIADFLNTLPARPVVSAFTATATPRVREDIETLLRLREPSVLVTGFNRPNLFFSVEAPKDKFAALLDFLSDKKDKPGIVYCSTRKTVEEVHARLVSLGIEASRYHAGLQDAERHSNQDDFLYDRARIMVATNAFGMGIDKSNVGFVVHYNMPKDIESYYQEAGRAGRDGGPADCLLLYSGQDVRTNQFLIEKSGAERNYEPGSGVEADALREAGLRLEYERLKRMTFYCTTSECLRAFILKYFGERPPVFCGSCGNCLAKFEEYDATTDARKILSCVIKSGERFGVATVVDILRGSTNEKITSRGLDKLSTYGICGTSEARLRQIINEMVMNELLVITDDRYPVVKRGVYAAALLKPEASFIIKLAREAERVKAKAAKVTAPRPVNGKLLEQLKALRLEIAREQSVPAFVIFADSTLMDMCMKLPLDDEAMLTVSGVGRVKLEKYGERFLAVVRAFSQGEAEGKDDGAGAFDGLVVSKSEPHGFGNCSPMRPGTAIADAEVSDEPVTVSVIADRINVVLLQKGIKKITGAKINELLMDRGYLAGEHKAPTESGLALGITAEKRVIRNIPCNVNFYDADAQRFVIGCYLAVLRLVKANIANSEEIHEMQVISFKPLLDKYKDYDTNPGAETLECVRKRLSEDGTDIYIISLNGKNIGHIRVRRLDDITCRLSQIFILPEYRSRGFARQATAQVEALYPEARKWCLDTIKQEKLLCHLYEKMGYRLTGAERNIKPGMDIVGYEKVLP